MAKPDWGIEGGFEILLAHLVSHLAASGHQVSQLTVPGPAPDHYLGERLVSDEDWAEHPEAFTYESLLHRFSQVDATEFDLVITTQPGSWAIEHPHKLALFYHHQRIFYDLAEKFAAMQDINHETHYDACKRIRSLDERYTSSISRFLAPSRTVANRLMEFWDIDSQLIDYFLAGPLSAVAGETKPRDPSAVVCVSRSEFTKRTELFVAAAHHGFGAPATLIGGGGQLPAVRRWAAEKAAGLRVHPKPWERQATYERVEVAVPNRPVAIIGRLSDADLLSHYDKALCLVAPACNEDYGLTALEAFTHGVPVIVCSDGGGLVEFIQDGVNGLIVEPRPDAIASAVRSLTDSPTLATQLSDGARMSAATYTWDRAHAQLDEAISAVMNDKPRSLIS